MKPFGAQKGHVVDFLFTLALFCVFAASALMVVVIGANVYRHKGSVKQKLVIVGTKNTYWEKEILPI